jgi:signal peptidase
MRLTVHAQDRFPAALLRGIGTLILVVLVLLCIPVTIPGYMGYQMYTVVSGSMEPAIPVGSLVYIRYEDPEQIRPEDVIAFYSGVADGGITTHRVVENRLAEGEFITKGDANGQEDVRPAAYGQLIGKMICCIPVLGYVASVLDQTSGKLLAAGMILVAILFHLLAFLLDKKTRGMDNDPL